MRAQGCGRSARPRWAFEGGALAGQGANYANPVTFRVLEPRPLASIRRASYAVLCPRLRGVVLLELHATTPHLFDGSPHFGDLDDGLRELARTGIAGNCWDAFGTDTGKGN